MCYFKNNEVEGFNKMSTEDKITAVRTKLKSGIKISLMRI